MHCHEGKPVAISAACSACSLEILLIIIIMILLTVKARRPISHSISVYMNVMS